MFKVFRPKEAFRLKVSIRKMTENIKIISTIANLKMASGVHSCSTSGHPSVIYLHLSYSETFTRGVSPKHTIADKNNPISTDFLRNDGDVLFSASLIISFIAKTPTSIFVNSPNLGI